MPSLRTRCLRIMMFAVVAMGLGIGILSLQLYLRQTELMYYPPQGVMPDGTLADFQSITIRTEDQIDLSGYFYPPQAGKPIVLVFHGNAGHPAWQAGKTTLLKEQGYGLLFAGYRGYVTEVAEPSELGFYKDAEAYIGWVQENYLGHPVVLYGESLGSAVVVEMATRHPVAAVILEVPFKSALSVAETLYPYIPWISWMMRDPYRSDLKIKNVSAPTLFLLAAQDEVVSYASGLELFDLADEPKTKIVYEQAGHNNVYQFTAAQDVLKFLDGVFAK